MKKSFSIMFLGLLLLLSTLLGQSAFPELESALVTKNEIYWSHLVRHKLSSHPERLKDFFELVAAYTLKDKINPQKITQLDRIRYAKYADQITGGRPEFMIDTRPNIQEMLFNRTVGTPGDFLISLKRDAMKATNSNKPVYQQAMRLFKALGAPATLSADEIIQNNLHMKALDQEQSRILRDADRGASPDYLKLSYQPYAGDAPKLQSAALMPAMRAITRLAQKEAKKAAKKATKKAKKILKETLDTVEDYFETDDPLSNEINITFDAPLHDSKVEIILGDYFSVDPSYFTEQAEKLSSEHQAIQNKLDALDEKLQRHYGQGEQHIKLTKTVRDKVEALSKQQLTKSDFDRSIKALEVSLSEQLDDASKKLLNQLIEQTLVQQQIKAQGKKMLAMCDKVLKHLQSEQEAQTEAEKRALKQYEFKMTVKVVGQSFSLAANVASLVGASDDLVKGLSLASEVVPEAMQAIEKLSELASKSQLTSAMQLEAFSNGLTLAGIGLKIISSFMGVKSADQVTHEYLRAISKQIQALHKDMVEKFKVLDTKIVHIIRQSEAIYTAILDNRAVIYALGEALKKAHQDKYLLELEEKELFLHTMIDTQTSMDNTKFAELMVFFTTFANLKVRNDLFVGYPNMRQSKLLHKLLELNYYNAHVSQPVFPIAHVQDYLRSLNLGLSPEHKKAALQTQGIHPELWRRNVDNLFKLITHAEAIMKIKDPRLLLNALEHLKTMQKTGLQMNHTLKSLCDGKMIKALLVLERRLALFCFEYEEHKIIQNEFLKYVTLIEDQALAFEGLFKFRVTYRSGREFNKIANVYNPYLIRHSWRLSSRNKEKLKKSVEERKKKKIKEARPKLESEKKQWAADKRAALKPDKLLEHKAFQTARTKQLEKHLQFLNAANVFGKSLALNEVTLEKAQRHKLYISAIIHFLLQLLQDTKVIDAAKAQRLMTLRDIAISQAGFSSVVREELARCMALYKAVPNPKRRIYHYRNNLLATWLDECFDNAVDQFVNGYYAATRETKQLKISRPLDHKTLLVKQPLERYNEAVDEHSDSYPLTRMDQLILNSADLELRLIALIQASQAKWMHPSLESGLKQTELLNR